MRHKLKTALALVGLSVVVIVAADLLGRVASAVDDRYSGPPADHLLADDDLRASLPAYNGVAYNPRALLEEVRKSDRTVYEPYTIWKRRAYRGEYTTIDIVGSRRTVGNSTSEDALQVWMFGGSAVWGVGAPDSETIPSHLAALLNRELGIDANVRNLGRRGYVSTQEVIYLIRELQAGRRPDIVVFYNGVNDAAAVSLWPEFPGAHVSFDTVRDRFESDGEGDDIRWFARSTGFYKASRIVLDRVESDTFERDGIIVYADQDTGTTPNYRWLAERGLDLWLFNALVIDSLARDYGFIPLMAFQPGLWSTGKPLDPSEESLIASEMEYAGLKTIMTVRAEMATVLDDRLSDPQIPNWVLNLNDLFSDTPAPLYIDYVHVTGRGNEIAAQRIATDLLDRLCDRPGERLSENTRRRLDAGCRRWAGSSTRST
ncbi:MAG: SGNH/GDSL hydrolase family protein [Dehalococcoidia bacterium]|nr:SGNH/GDSL hydrolase family protein [Dehalococcoidia bacterium]